MPPARADDSHDGFSRACTVEDVPDGALCAVTLDDGSRVCVGNRGGTFFAVSDRCPHQTFPLSDGELTREGAIVCSWHGAAYDCLTGRAISGPFRGGGVREGPLGRLKVYDVRVRDGSIFVRAPQELF